MPKYKKRKDGRYAAQIAMGYHDNGKVKYKTLYGYTIKELEDKETKFRSNLNKGIIIDDKGYTVGEWADKWFETYKSNTSHYSKRRYESIIKIHIKPKFGILKLDKLKHTDIQQYINELAEKYSLSTIRKTKDTLSQMYESAIISQLIYYDPTIGIKLPKKQYEEKKVVSKDDIMKLNLFCKNNKHGNFVMTLLYTRVRRGEIIPLAWGDVDFNNNTIKINKSVEFINNRPNVKPPKTLKGIRIIPLLNVLRVFLYKRHETGKIKLGKKNIDNELLFKNENGEMHTGLPFIFPDTNQMPMVAPIH